MIFITIITIVLFPLSTNAYYAPFFMFPPGQPQYFNPYLPINPWYNGFSYFSGPPVPPTQAPFFNPGYFTPTLPAFSSNFSRTSSGIAPYSFASFQPNIYFPVPQTYQYPAYGNTGITNPFFRPDPQWQLGREIIPPAPASQTVPVTGIDTGELRMMPPVNQNIMHTSYIPGIAGYVNRQLVLMFRPDVPVQERARVMAMHNCAEIRTSPYSGITLVALPTFMSVKNAAEAFLSEPSVLYAEPNYLRHAHLIPNDIYFRYQWHLPWPHLSNILAWDLTTGLGVTVAVVDSGVAYRTAAPYAAAPDLAGTSIIPGWDFVNADAYPDDDSGHGTHMCGCIAQTTNNFRGVAGVAFSSTIMAIKVMDSLGDVSVADEADGIYYAVNNGAQIINLSLGGPGVSLTEQTAVTYAYNSGLTIIGSAGNSGSSVPEYPASYTECISVGAVQYDQTTPSYSNYGTELDLVAPGGNTSVDQNFDGYGDGILQQTHDGTTFTSFFYYFMEGTSPACALASGVAALVMSKSTTALGPLQVKSILESTATDLGATGWDQYFGWGEINAYRAVANTP